MSEDEVFYLPKVPDMPIAGTDHGHQVTFIIPVVKSRPVSSTPHLVPQPVSFDLSGIPNTETSGKDTDSEAEGRPNVGIRSRPTLYHQKIRRTRQDASITMHSLQLVAEEFWKIFKPKIQKLKSGYSANVVLVFNSWLKDEKIGMREQKLTNLEAVQLIKNCTTENVTGVVEFYLDMTST